MSVYGENTHLMLENADLRNEVRVNRDALRMLMAYLEDEDGVVNRDVAILNARHVLGPICSICRRRHGHEIEHVSE